MTNRIIERIEGLRNNEYIDSSAYPTSHIAQTMRNAAINSCLQIIREESEREVSQDEIERVAKALYETNCTQEDSGKPSYWKQCPEEWRDDYIRDAKAAIQAMRKV